jgi:hypothetical protein
LSLGLARAVAAVLRMLVGRVGYGLYGGLLAAIVSPTLAHAALPRGRQAEVRACFPRWEMPVRMAVTALLIVGLTVAGERFGPTVAGVLAALPTLASVLAVFTHARHGHDALVAMLRGMLGGLGSFVTFCALIALLVEPTGVIPAFVLALRRPCWCNSWQPVSMHHPSWLDRRLLTRTDVSERRTQSGWTDRVGNSQRNVEPAGRDVPPAVGNAHDARGPGRRMFVGSKASACELSVAAPFHLARLP